MLNRTNIVLVVLLAIVLLIPVVTRVDYSQPNYEFLPEMKRSPAWSTYEANPNFPNGRTLQPPVPGTIARGQLPIYDYQATKEDALRAGEELTNPYDLSLVESSEASQDAKQLPDKTGNGENGENGEKLDPAEEQKKRLAAPRDRLRESTARGGGLFRVFCVCCHGAGGGGDGPVAKRGYPPPPSLLTGKSAQMKDGQLFHILTHGQGNMPPFPAELSPDDRWDVINHVRDLQSKAKPADEAAR